MDDDIAVCAICGHPIAANKEPITGYRHAWENGYPEVPFHLASPVLERPSL